jgi:hypothetical protein
MKPLYAMPPRRRQRGFIINPYAYGSGAAATDPHFANVVGLFHFDGANGGTTFTDSSSYAHTMTRVGLGTTSTAQSRFGPSSYLAAASSLLKTANTNFLLSNLSFTIESWVYLTGGSGERVICGVWDTGGISWIMTIGTGDVLTFYYSTDGSSGNFTFNTSGFSVPTNAWTHVAACRDGTTIRLFIGGVARYTNSSFSQTCYNGTSVQFSLGGQTSGGSAIASFVGHIDDLRITKGVARYTADFTPPTQPFPNS